MRPRPAVWGPNAFPFLLFSPSIQSSTACQNGLDCWQQIRGNGACPHEAIGPGVHRCLADARLVVEAEDDQLHRGAALAQPSEPVKIALAGERDVHHRHFGLQPTGALLQRVLIGYPDHAFEHRLEQAAHAFRQTEVTVCKEDAGVMRLVRGLVPLEPPSWRAPPAGCRRECSCRRRQASISTALDALLGRLTCLAAAE